MAVAIAIPLVFAGGELLAWAAVALGAAGAVGLAAKQLSKSQQQRYAERKDIKAQSGSSNGGGKGCPPHSFGSKDVDYIAKSLGMNRKQLGTNIHRIKTQIENNPDVLICAKCGRVESPGGDHIGNVRDG